VREQLSSERNLAESMPSDGWGILDRLSLPVLVINSDHSIAYSNAAAQTEFLPGQGQTGAEFCYRLVLGHDTPCGPGGSECLLSRLWATGEPASAIHEVRLPDGGCKLAAITAVTLRPAGNGPVQAVVTFQDVTRHLMLERSLYRVLVGVANTTGIRFFQALAQQLSEAIGMESVLVGRYLREQHAVSSLAYYSEGQHSSSFSYPLEGTPCAQVLLGKLVCIENEACQTFAQDEFFTQARIESYAGVPMYDTRGEVVGLLAGLSKQPLAQPEVVRAILSAFAARAAGELERMDAEQTLRLAQMSLEQEITRRTVALRESQERYQLLFNSGSDAVMVFRLEALSSGKFAPGRFITVNDVAVKRYGYSREELLDLTPQTLNTPASLMVLPDLLAEVKQNKRAMYRSEHITKNGKRFPVEVSSQLLELDGRPVVLANIRDISERLAAEAALRQSEERFRSIIENTPVGMCISNEGGAFEYVNASFCDTLGYAMEELLGEPLTLTARREHKSLLQAAHHNVIHGGGEFRGEIELQRKDGVPLVVLMDAVRITGADGGLKKVAFILDVTASKRSQELLRQMALLAELSPEPIVRFDHSGRVLLANAASVAVLQQPGSVGRFLPDLIPELAGFDFAGCIEQAGLRDLACMKSERTYRLTVRGVPELQFGQLYATDITDTVRARQEAEAASLAKSQFLANMSHELRTPLSAINGFSEVLLEGAFGSLTSQQREYVQRINQSGQHLLLLINDLLDLAKIEAGKLELMREDFDLRLVCHEACDLISGRVQHRGLVLVRELPGVPVAYAGDKLRLRQVLINLLSNAVKFTERGTVTVSLEMRDEYYKLGVRDTGIGIAPEKLSRLFKRFEQVHDQRLVGDPGSGLGLSLCREIVTAHGGSISVESAPGEGSLFLVTLPREKA
jgi:PAS domain S-box-containing protein